MGYYSYGIQPNKMAGCIQRWPFVLRMAIYVKAIAETV